MKNPRSKSYLATFPNTSKGNRQYKTLITDIRKVVTGGRFIKMFRGGTRHYDRFINYQGKHVTMGGACSLNDGTRFDVYLLGRDYNFETQSHDYPKFFGFELKGY
jgi:hypothetical protein